MDVSSGTARLGSGASGSRPIRVLCVTPSGPEGRGGIDRLYGYLRAAGRPSTADGVDLRYIASRGSAPGARWMLAFPGRALAFVALLARFRPDVVHINFATGGSLVRKFVLAEAARAFRTPVVLHFHGGFPLEAIAAGTATGRVFVALCRRADGVIPLGEVTRQRFIEHAGVAPERIRVVPNGIVDFAGGKVVDTGTSGPIRILFAGEVGEHKGVAVLIGALARLPDTTAWSCTICGNGDIARYRAIAREAGLAERIRFTGWMPIEEIHRLMREADIVVLPSLSENMPLSLIEGTCAGAALVATPGAETGAIVKDGENGWIVSRDSQEIADALARLMADRPTLARMQARSRAIYEANFTLDALADRLIAIYREFARR